MEKKINNSISIKTNNEVFYDIFLKNFLKKYNNKIFNNFYLYFELKKSNAYDYIKKETEYDSIFISTSISLKYNLSYCFLTRNSRNTIYTKYYNISDDLFNFYSDLLFEYKPKISYKNDGYIVIYLPNLDGHFKDYINLNNLITLITKIRSKKKNNKILLRIHSRNFKQIKNNEHIIKIMKLFDNIKLDKQKYKWDEIIKNCYCVFCQNTTMCFTLYGLGIPIFNMQNVINLNIYPELSINFEYFNNFEIKFEKIDRKNILSKYYSSLIIKSSFEHIIDKDKYNIEDYIKNNEFDTTLYKFYENNFNKKNSKKYLDDHFGIYYYLNYFFQIIINFVYKMFSIFK